RMPWAIAFAFPLDTLAAVFANGSSTRPAKAARGPSRPTDAPFADMPIDMAAVLVDMALPLATISRLQVGQVLPVPIARNVPLVVGDKIYAHGSIGAIEDRVAIQISQLS
ncbi:MAG: FliM/FliN family flagellar motor C-terminal domain-containing protein, partial [Novosphingobium sp.]|nr:FliM/FliN family flagellar motor C-terminal domain-containing protein [Novosphingobium sp.]